MAIPSIQAPTIGGPLNEYFNALNSLNNNIQLRRYNKTKADYAPTTLSSEAASKLAYANLMGPQFMAKLMGNSPFVANMPEDSKKQAVNMLINAANGQRGSNALSQQNYSGVGQPSTNAMSGWVKNSLQSIIGNNSKSPSINAITSPISEQQNQPQVGDAVMGDDESMNPALSAYDEWLRSPEGKAEVNKGEKGNFPTPQEALEWQRNKNLNPMQMTLTKGMNSINSPKTYSENAGEQQGIINEGAESGKLRAQNLDDIGKQQLTLSNTGANLDRLVDDFTDPKFMSLRDKFPLLQDTQLKIAAKTGTKEQQEMIGKIISDLESFKGATVNSFSGQTLKREFDYADKIKPSESDTVYTALGKLHALKSLKEIAWQKNKMIKDLMQKKHMSLADAVQIADKTIDIKKIDEEVKNVTQPMVKIENIKNPKNYLMITKARAEELGFR